MHYYTLFFLNSTSKNCDEDVINDIYNLQYKPFCGIKTPAPKIREWVSDLFDVSVGQI